MSSENPYQSSLSDAAVHRQQPRGPFKTLLTSFAVMAPWPLVAFLLVQSMVGRADEVALLFGGITMIFLLPVFLIAPNANLILVILVVAVWIIVCIVPAFIPKWRNKNAYIVQTCFALGQALLGGLMLLGKAV